MPRGSKLTKAMAHHIFGDVDRYMAATVMYCDRVAHHLGEDRAIPAPGSEHLLIAFGIHSFYSFQEFGLDVRPFL